MRKTYQRCLVDSSRPFRRITANRFVQPFSGALLTRPVVKLRRNGQRLTGSVGRKWNPCGTSCWRSASACTLWDQGEKGTAVSPQHILFNGLYTPVLLYCLSCSRLQLHGELRWGVATSAVVRMLEYNCSSFAQESCRTSSKGSIRPTSAAV